MNNNRRNSRGERGVAIIMVVGMLGVIMLAAVAFSIIMRVERRGSANYRHSVQARHMLWAALSRAIDDIETNFATNIVVYPEWNLDTIASTFFSEHPADSGETRAVTRSGDSVIPGSLKAGFQNVKPRWRYMYWRDAANMPLVLGRYAYVVINASGLLDANWVGSPTRAVGASTREIPLNTVLSQPTAFLTARTNHVRYETLSEMRQLEALTDTDAYQGNLRSLALSSRSPVGMRLRNAHLPRAQWTAALEPLAQIDLSGDAEQIKPRKAEILAAFTEIGRLTPLQANTAFDNLLAYVDPSPVPSNVNGPMVKPVPMINEVEVMVGIVPADAGMMQVVCAINFECFYPFAQDNARSYELRFRVRTQAQSGNTLQAAIPVFPVAAQTEQIVPANFLVGTRVQHPDGVYRVATIEPRFGGAFDSTTVTNVNFSVFISATVRDGDGNLADSVPGAGAPDNVDAGFRFDFAFAAPAVDDEESQWFEAVDPRFNWDISPAADPIQWVSGAVLRSIPGFENRNSTMGDINNFTGYMFSDQYEASVGFSSDGDTRCFVALRPLRTIGELGNICYDIWSTFRLYKQELPTAEGVQFHPVADYFFLSRIPDGTPQGRPVDERGRVNINTRNRDVLAAAFFNAPLNDYASSPTRITLPQSYTIADAIIANRPYRGIAAIGALDVWRSLVYGGGPPGSVSLAREGALRNSFGLLTVRHNQFLVFLVADSFSTSIGGVAGSRLATTRAVAEVWRDPFPDENRQHRKFIRSFLNLTD